MLPSLKKVSSVRSFVKILFNTRNCNRLYSTNRTTTNTSGKVDSPFLTSSPPPFNFNYKADWQKEHAQFMLAFPDVVRELIDFGSDKYLLRDVANHFGRALEYNVPNGKKIRGLTALLAYNEFAGESANTSENRRKAHLLAWCIELIQSVYLMADDIIDRSEIRRGKACWYRVEDVKTIAINDILMIENGIYVLLKRLFGHLPCYQSLCDMFHETAFTTFTGQSMDFEMARNGVTHFTMDKHIIISHYKTSHSAFYAPIVLPMILTGFENGKILADLKVICFQMGHFYQLQNDFFDCFQNLENNLNKSGTDIEEGKCTWLAIKVMESGTDQQKAIMRECYGKSDPECVEKVQHLYIDFGFQEMYSQHEEKTYNSLKNQIQQFSVEHNFPKAILMTTLDRLFSRN